jgi:hypothetical protein
MNKCGLTAVISMMKPYHDRRIRLVPHVVFMEELLKFELSLLRLRQECFKESAFRVVGASLGLATVPHSTLDNEIQQDTAIFLFSSEFSFKRLNPIHRGGFV